MTKAISRILVVTALLMECQYVLSQETPVKAFGSYWNVKSDGEHASGHSIDLWKQGGKILGIISVHSGLIGDPPTGLLENVVFDPHTHKLSFTAQTDWITTYKNGQFVKVPLVYRFDGKATSRRVVGVITSDKYRGDRKRIVLRRSREWSGFQEDFRSLALWQAYVKRILDRKGPKK